MNWKKLLFSKAGLVLLLAGFAGITYLLTRELFTRYHIEKEISALSEEIMKIEQSNEHLSDTLDYFRSQSFQEQELRRKLNLQKPGEHVVVLPAELLGEGPQEPDINPLQSPSPQTRFREWWDYFFKRK